jgi:hypothetical protein
MTTTLASHEDQDQNRDPTAGVCCSCDQEVERRYLVCLMPRMLACRACLTELSYSTHYMGEGYETA